MAVMGGTAPHPRKNTRARSLLTAAMKLFRWEPKQKLRKEDIPVLVAKYRSLQESSHLMISMLLPLTAMVALIMIAFREFATMQTVMALFMIYFVGAFGFAVSGLYSVWKASKIAKVLEIGKRLKRYGVD